MDARTPVEKPELPFGMDHLEPYISRETLEYHYGKHHLTYYNNLVGLLKDHEYKDLSLEEIIQKSHQDIGKKPGAIGMYRNAAQIWNHSFYWNSLAADGGGKPPFLDLEEFFIEHF